MCASYAYFGSVFSVGALSANIYFNSTWGTAVNVFTPFFYIYAANHYKRKSVFITVFATTMILASYLYFLEIP